MKRPLLIAAISTNISKERAPAWRRQAHSLWLSVIFVTNQEPNVRVPFLLILALI